MNSKNFNVIGKGVVRVDGLAKVTGKCKYLDDITLPGMLYSKILRSPHAHAKILRIDASQAEKIPGVRAIITAKDIPNIKFSFNQNLADKLALCKDKVRYVGDEVAAIAADSLEIAEFALDKIQVEYEVLEAVYDPEEAVKSDCSVLLHDEKENNIAFEFHNEYGNVKEGFEQSDYIFEDQFITSRPAHCCLEPRGCIAYFDDFERLCVWTPAQSAHTLKKELSIIMGLDENDIHVINTPAGGSFGSRLVMDMKEPIAAWLSKKTGRPVKIVNTREEEFATAKHRYPWVIKLKTGITKEGKILARHINIILDNGAYCDKGSNTISYSYIFFTSLYNVPNMKNDAYLVYTNKAMSTAFRGFGNPQIHFSVESQNDLIAKKLQMDPIEFRLKNIVRNGDITCSGIRISNCGLEDCIKKAAEKVNWKSTKSKSSLEYQKLCGNKRKGIGIAIMIHSGAGTRYYGYNSTETFIKVSKTGLVNVITPVPEIGQGSMTVVAQIVAEVLGITVDDINIQNQDTDIIPYDLGAFGSRTTFICGNAAKLAAEDTKKELIKAAAKYFNTEENNIVFENGIVYSINNSDKKIKFKELTKYSYEKLGYPIAGRGKYYDEVATKIGLIGNYELASPENSYGCQIIELEVDLETGEVRVINVVAVIDSGKTINPITASGQIEGSVIQGLGYALTEHIIYGPKGEILNPNFMDYKILRSTDIPSMEVYFVEAGSLLGPFGAKGVGELGLVPTAAAVANALYDATGLKFTKLPITREEVLKKCGVLS
jgi:CO/xanthine dehydrogenase Mo-binding subunit